MTYINFVQLRLSSLNRLFVMLLLFVASIMLGLALNSGESWAQTSVSPLATPVSRFVPATEALAPPTNTPPAELVVWPTPVSTPFPSAVEQAIDFLVDAEDLSASALLPVTNQVVNDPADSSDQFIAVRILDEESRQFYWVLVSQSDGPFFPPDYSQEALEILTQEAALDEADLDEAALDEADLDEADLDEADLDEAALDEAALDEAALDEAVLDEAALEVDDLLLVMAEYRLYPFAEQLIWIGEAVTVDGAQQFTLALDLSGEVVDLEEIEEIEAGVRVIACGPIEDDLCTTLRLGGASVDVLVTVTVLTDEALDAVTELLEEEGVEFETDLLTVTTRVPAWLIMEIAALDDISEIERDSANLLLPLDSHIAISLSEVGGELSLNLTSARWYPYFKHQIEATGGQEPLAATNPTTFTVGIAGVTRTDLSPENGGVATAQIPLGDLFGIYNLTLSYEDDSGELALQDRYGIIVTEGRIIMRSQEISFTWPIYNSWLRLPEDAIWFVVHSRATDEAADLDEYEEAVEIFYESIELFGAEPLTLQEGVYTHNLFVPPWESWQVTDGDLTQVSLNNEVAYLFKWPDIRYFVYTDDMDIMLEIMQENCTEEIEITLFTASGETVACEP
jgi:hypothetical protein